MLVVFVYSVVLIAALFGLGLGVSSLFLSLIFGRDEIIWWLSPWVGTVFVAILAVYLSAICFPMSSAAYIIVVIGSIFTGYAFFKKKIPPFPFSLNSIALIVVTIATYIIHLYPLLAQVGFPTVVSLGNLDPISYVHVADFLRDNNIHDGGQYQPYSPFLWAVGDLLHNGYRWGSPLILSFFAQLLHIRSYQVFSIVLTLYFALSFPLVYFIAKKAFASRKADYMLLFLLFITYALNSTLSYMLYNVFFAQFIFNGIFIFIVLLLYQYISGSSTKKTVNVLDIFIAASISALTTVYAEGSIFVIIPLIALPFIGKLFKLRAISFFSVLKILAIAVVINPYSVSTAIQQYIRVFFLSVNTSFIGWEYIRSALPLEIMGFYNLYYSRHLPLFISVIVSVPIIFVWVVGILKMRGKALSLSLLVVFALIYFFYRFLSPNYFTYHRAITYSLFLYPMFFSIGLITVFYILKQKTRVTVVIFILLSFLSIRSFYRGIYQMYYHQRIVDKSLVSLEELNKNNKVKEPFFTADVFLGEYDLWRRLWQEYMVRDKMIITRQNYLTDKNKTKKIKLVLAEKTMLEYDGKKLDYISIVWRNDFYQLGVVKQRLNW